MEYHCIVWKKTLFGRFRSILMMQVQRVLACFDVLGG